MNKTKKINENQRSQLITAVPLECGDGEPGCESDTVAGSSDDLPWSIFASK
jgi:hypothetical protein